jgi:hypothetical protein
LKPNVSRLLKEIFVNVFAVQLIDGLDLARTSLSDAALQRFHQVHDVASGRTLRFFRNDSVTFRFFVDETRLRSSDWSRRS